MTLSSELTAVHEGLLPRADAAQGCVIHPTVARHIASQLHIHSIAERVAARCLLTLRYFVKGPVSPARCPCCGRYSAVDQSMLTDSDADRCTYLDDYPVGYPTARRRLPGGLPDRAYRAAGGRRARARVSADCGR